MRIKFKLYASLGDYLPASARENAVEIEVDNELSLNALLDRHGVPREMAHLVLVNGVYQGAGERDRPLLRNGDTVAVWPPVAGG
ncbi:MAG: MoaD/ThiS family protein [Proteobacteria bacterium]|nr:MAG: MoaD/ThiS family protein [Pseudomonadota bacterium]